MESLIKYNMLHHHKTTQCMLSCIRCIPIVIHFSCLSFRVMIDFNPFHAFLFHVLRNFNFIFHFMCWGIITPFSFRMLRDFWPLNDFSRCHEGLVPLAVRVCSINKLGNHHPYHNVNLSLILVLFFICWYSFPVW
jgi:hypothetical protein